MQTPQLGLLRRKNGLCRSFDASDLRVTCTDEGKNLEQVFTICGNGFRPLSACVCIRLCNPVKLLSSRCGRPWKSPSPSTFPTRDDGAGTPTAKPIDVARDHLEHGQAAVGSLGDDGNGQMIKGGHDRLGERLASA